MHADTELELVLVSVLCQLFLKRQGATHCLYRTPKLGQHAVACGIGNPASMLTDLPFGSFAYSSKSSESCGLVRQHISGVVHDIRRHDGGEAMLEFGI